MSKNDRFPNLERLTRFWSRYPEGIQFSKRRPTLLRAVFQTEAKMISRLWALALAGLVLSGCGIVREQQFRQAQAAWPREAQAEFAKLCRSKGESLPADYLNRPLTPVTGQVFYIATELETVLGQPRPCGLSRTERTQVAYEAYTRHVVPFMDGGAQAVTTWIRAVDLYLADLFDQGKLRSAQAEFLALEARRLAWAEYEDRLMRRVTAQAQQSQAAAAWMRVFQEQWRMTQPQEPIPVQIVPGPLIPVR